MVRRKKDWSVDMAFPPPIKHQVWKMEAIKKKLANLKEEKEAAIEKADEIEAQKKESDARADAVRNGGWGTVW